ncbi:unnamed protein product [Rhizoctonia solani]|uniref:Uncharacterized protein n=1 Tax=Rhizoctonia solani TaxID=456999 RepID=A0A8H3E8I0_9AGAM|nr:unnamed protein product [Rhizoctonia solani]
MSDAAHRRIWTPKKRVLPEIHVPARPMSSDVYKSRLLAYATAVADQMSNSGDEDPVEQQTNKHINLPGTKRVAASPRTASSFVLLDNRVSNTLPEDLGLSGYTEDHTAMPGPYTETLDPNDRTKLKRTEPLDSGRLDHSTDRTQLTPLKFGAFDNGRSDELVPTNLDIICAHLEDHEKEYQSDDAIDELEESDPLVSEYEVVQEDYDVLAADEPSDDEGGPTEQHQATARQGSQWEHSVPDMVDAASKMLEAPKRDPRIQPFPMKVSCHSPVPNPTAPDKTPKFIPQHSRRV